MKIKNLLPSLMLAITLMISNQYIHAQACLPGEVWSCISTPSGYHCLCVDANSIYGETCPDGQQLACRKNRQCDWECECVDTDDVTKWLSHSRKCGVYIVHGNPHWNWRSAENQEDLQYETFIEGVYPNPIFNTAIISFSLSRAQRVSLQVFDMSGRLISTIADHAFKKGENQIEWNAGEISDGIYFIRMVAGEVVQTEKTMIAK